MKKIILLAIFIAATVSLSAQNRVVVVVDGIEEVKGSLLVAIYNSEGSYMKKPFKVTSAKIANSTEEVTFDLPDGTYSVSMFQDANSNNKMDRGNYGIPTEKYGFSNNAMGNMGPPTFKDTKVFVDKDLVIRINLE